MSDRLLITGIVGSVVSALCCFTPVLGLVLGTIGLAGLVVYADAVLLPALAVFLLLTGYALWKWMRRHSSRPPG